MNKKWVAAWSTAPSYGEQMAQNCAHNVTLRYIIHTPISGTKLRLTLSNHCGNEAVTLDKVAVAPYTDKGVLAGTTAYLTFGGKQECAISKGGQTVSDELPFTVKAGDNLAVSIYIGGYADMSTACSSHGPYTSYAFSKGDRCEKALFNDADSNAMGFCHYLTEVDLLADDSCRSLVAFGDSITAQSWPEWLIKNIEAAGITNQSVARRAVSGSRVLRQYDCICYAKYGLKGADRFVREINTAGADTVFILHGVNDIIHPEVEDATGYRPIEHLPTPQQLIEGLQFYADTARKAGLKVYMGTILPIKGWRSYQDFREPIRQGVNEWIRTTDKIDGYVDFDLYMKNPQDELTMIADYDSGDHLHPSIQGAQKMADLVFEKLFK